MEDKRVAVVTGGNRGIGFETCRQLAARGYRVVLGSRDLAKGRAAAAKLTGEGFDLFPFQLDVTDDEQAAALTEFVRAELGRVDALINNAGVFLDNGGFGRSGAILSAPLDVFKITFETNVLGPIRLCQALIPMMLERGYGRVVNLSSGLGQLASMSGGYPAYRLSKAAINALTRTLAAEVGAHNVLVNSADPGWVRTDMGGPSAASSVEQGADTVVWLATLPDGGPSGGFFRHRQPVPW
jgi:NAD(P)-dependent dehydrogenase (short-subunit alcohol dehydrogenase family)